MIKISIIIPTFNRGLLLKNVLEDISEQTFQDIELIIIDDHSIDATEEVIHLFQLGHPNLKVYYLKNLGNGQRDAKKQGLEIASGEYMLFLEDDIRLKNKVFLEKIVSLAMPTTVLQSKIIMQDKGEVEFDGEYWLNTYLNRPFFILEWCNFKKNYGKIALRVFPIMETWVLFHQSLKKYFIDENLIKDAYGESFVSGIQLIRNGIKILLSPESVIYHLWSETWGSKKFDKKALIRGFSEFHYWYFYNMVYIQSRFLPISIIIWLPFYIGKCCVAVLINWDFVWMYRNGLTPIARSLWKFFIKRSWKN